MSMSGKSVECHIWNGSAKKPTCREMEHGFGVWSLLEEKESVFIAANTAKEGCNARLEGA